MRTLPKILGACAILALAASAAWAASNVSQHRLTVWLPGGGSETIIYAGDVAPKVSFTGIAPASFWSPLAGDFVAFNEAVPIDRIAAAMDADMAAMIRQADALLAMPVMAPFNDITEADLKAMPPGSQGYSVISTSNGHNVCTRSVQITESGNGKPQISRHSLGNCVAVPDTQALFNLAPGEDSHLTNVKSMTPQSAPSHPRI